MDKGKSPVLGGEGEESSFPASPSSAPVPLATPEPGHFGHDISLMPENSRMTIGHRRALSETLGLPENIGGGGPLLEEGTDEDFLFIFLDMEKFSSSPLSSPSGLLGSETSVMAAPSPPPTPQTDNLISASNEEPRVRLQRSQSLDGPSSFKLELLASSSEGLSAVERKKARSFAKLAEIALADPKRARRIMSNRRSAVRCKEKKMRYLSEIEQTVQTLQTEKTRLSAQLAALQKDTSALSFKNSELKLHQHTMEEDVKLQNELMNVLREEVQRLKVATGQAILDGGQMMDCGSSSFSGNQQFYHHDQAVQSLLVAHHLQQLQIHSLHQQQVHPRPQQPPPDLEVDGAMTSQSQREGTLGNNSTSKE